MALSKLILSKTCYRAGAAAWTAEASQGIRPRGLSRLAAWALAVAGGRDLRQTLSPLQRRIGNRPQMPCPPDGPDWWAISCVWPASGAFSRTLAISFGTSARGARSLPPPLSSGRVEDSLWCAVAKDGDGHPPVAVPTSGILNCSHSDSSVASFGKLCQSGLKNGVSRCKVGSAAGDLENIASAAGDDDRAY